ncbi:sugar fermentation stimulation protein A [Marinobacter daqiaonensis]|uniref:Sugar fermentation stimulation protein homolog n=1 Tax=Marinobacter daqiaonensis TaxID=650891 RepID=A0A1I6JWB3_9GAMM|nr:DNA/RNA nuclease SfsA [Marinobacter daqiaonensis]SFR83284.1 sugar fermentation stimulation protein A [Marinobacter daqiaonensis]
MKFPEPLIEGRLVKRYKRFMADVRLPDGSTVTAHCPNTGSMQGCQPPDARVWLSPASNPARKLRYTWELVETGPGQIACINTARPNAQARAAVEAGRIASLADYGTVRAEVRYGDEKSRIDLHLSGHESRSDAWVEVKNVTLCEDGIGYFPDAVTLRGQKHLRELMAQVRGGDRAILLFCVNHTGIREVRPADHIDPAYGELLREAASQGVEVMAWQAELEAGGEPSGSLVLVRELAVVL